MVIITFARLREYAIVHADIKIALFHWYNVVTKADWSCLADVRNEFPNVDYVGDDRYVFNIRGNNYRVVVMIHFDIRTVYVRFIGTHAEYDKVVARDT